MNATEISKISEYESRKYVDLYNSRIGLPTTPWAPELGEFMANISPKGSKLLELGCGRGQAVEYLIKNGYECLGIDLVSEGIHDAYSTPPNWFTETSLWNLPFEDNAFDCVFSTDVMEHIPPELVEMAMREIYRVTKTETFHAISNLPCSPYHMTVKPVQWWEAVFEGQNTKKIGTYLIESRSSHTLFHYINKRGTK